MNRIKTIHQSYIYGYIGFLFSLISIVCISLQQYVLCAAFALAGLIYKNINGLRHENETSLIPVYTILASIFSIGMVILHYYQVYLSLTPEEILILKTVIGFGV